MAVRAPCVRRFRASQVVSDGILNVGHRSWIRSYTDPTTFHGACCAAALRLDIAVHRQNRCAMPFLCRITGSVGRRRGAATARSSCAEAICADDTSEVKAPAAEARAGLLAARGGCGRGGGAGGSHQS